MRADAAIVGDSDVRIECGGNVGGYPADQRDAEQEEVQDQAE
jgi:hypothetical protein